MKNDYFIESVPDGIANAVYELFPETECNGQDGYELLLDTFGNDVTGKRFKAFSAQHCAEMALNIRTYFELEKAVSPAQGRYVIKRALRQWMGSNTG